MILLKKRHFATQEEQKAQSQNNGQFFHCSTLSSRKIHYIVFLIRLSKVMKTTQAGISE